MMRDDTEYLLNDLLASWHVWSLHTAARSGLPGRAAGFGQSRSNSQFDWESGVESDLVDKRIMQGFDDAIQRVPQPFLTALQFEARNLAARHQVWASPRLPSNRQEREQMISRARGMLLKELGRDGVLC